MKANLSIFNTLSYLKQGATATNIMVASVQGYCVNIQVLCIVKTKNKQKKLLKSDLKIYHAINVPWQGEDGFMNIHTFYLLIIFLIMVHFVGLQFHSIMILYISLVHYIYMIWDVFLGTHTHRSWLTIIELNPGVHYITDNLAQIEIQAIKTSSTGAS